MPKSIARRKTKKAVAKRFKITASGKILASQSGRRHLAGSKNRKRKRHLAKMKQVDKTDEYRIKANPAPSRNIEKRKIEFSGTTTMPRKPPTPAHLANAANASFRKPKDTAAAAVNFSATPRTPP